MAEKVWTTIIKPHDKLWRVNLREIWQYRDLWRMFIHREIVTQYKQTVLGPVWYFVQPALTTVMYMVVFGGIAGISTDGLPQPLFYLAGICVWQYFADCLNKTSNIFVTHESIFGKVYFPRLVVPLATVTANLVRLGIQLLLFLLVYGYYLIIGVPVAPQPLIVLFPLLVLMLSGLALGFGTFISSLTTKYRDLTVLFTFVVQLWMYATPIVYPLSTVKKPLLRTVMQLNPITPIVEAFKFMTLGKGVFSWPALAYSLGFTLVLVVLGVVIFNKVQRSFMDTV